MSAWVSHSVTRVLHGSDVLIRPLGTPSTSERASGRLFGHLADSVRHGDHSSPLLAGRACFFHKIEHIAVERAKRRIELRQLVMQRPSLRCPYLSRHDTSCITVDIMTLLSSTGYYYLHRYRWSF